MADLNAANPPSTIPESEALATFGNRLRQLLANFPWPVRLNQTLSLVGKARLKIPVFDSDPATSQQGEVALIGGRLKASTAADTWSQVGGYVAQIASDGTGSILPSGWSATKLGTGNYKLTHGFGTTSYGVSIISLDGIDNVTVAVSSLQSNYIEYYVRNAGTVTDGAVSVIILRS